MLSSILRFCLTTGSLWLLLYTANYAQSIPSSSEYNIRPQQVNQTEETPELKTKPSALSNLAIQPDIRIVPLSDSLSKSLQSLDKSNMNLQEALTTASKSLTVLQSQVNDLKPNKSSTDLKKQNEKLLAQINMLQKKFTAKINGLNNSLNAAKEQQKKFSDETSNLKKDLARKDTLLWNLSSSQQDAYLAAIKQDYKDLQQQSDELSKQKKRRDTLETAMQNKLDRNGNNILWLKEQSRFLKADSLLNDWATLLDKHEKLLNSLIKVIGYKYSYFDFKQVSKQADSLKASSSALAAKRQALDTQLKTIDNLLKDKTKATDNSTISRALDALPNLVGTTSTFLTPNVTILGRNDKTDGSSRRVYGTVFVGADVKDSLLSKKQNLINIMLPAASTLGIQFGYSKPFKLDFTQHPDDERIYNGSVTGEGNFLWKRIPNMDVESAKTRKYAITPIIHLRGFADITLIKDRLSLYGIANWLMPLSETVNFYSFYKEFKDKPLTFFNAGFKANFPINTTDKGSDLILVDLNLVFNNQQTRNFLNGDINQEVNDLATLVLQIGYRASFGSTK